MKAYKEIIYENYISNHNEKLYGENSLTKITAYFPVLNHYYGRHIPQNKDIRILDLGCGDGNSVYWLQKLGYKNVYGVDVSKEQIEKGTRMGIANLQNADIVQYLSENKNNFDVIIAKDVIEHFTKDEVFEILQLINKNLNPEGRFVMQVPNGEGLFYTSVFYGDYTHEAAYTANSINQIILNTGYRKSNCYPTGPIPISFVSTIRFMLWKIKVMQLKFWKMVETGNPKGIFTQNIIAVIEK